MEEKEEKRSPVSSTESTRAGRVGGDQQDEDDVISTEKERDQTYSAETIALRRFMTMVAWGPGLSVMKHNRGRGRVRRVLKFNDEVGLVIRLRAVLLTRFMQGRALQHEWMGCVLRGTIKAVALAKTFCQILCAAYVHATSPGVACHKRSR